jgi:hypothetical protein
MIITVKNALQRPTSKSQHATSGRASRSRMGASKVPTAMLPIRKASIDWAELNRAPMRKTAITGETPSAIAAIRR